MENREEMFWGRIEGNCEENVGEYGVSSQLVDKDLDGRGRGRMSKEEGGMGEKKRISGENRRECGRNEGIKGRRMWGIHGKNVFVSRDLDLRPFDSKINGFPGLIVEHFSFTFGDPSCSVF